jgi:hypothetical protein
MSSSIHSRLLWVADRVGRDNWVKIVPSTGVRCELLSENCLVFNLYSSLLFLYVSLLFFIFLYFSLPIKIN